MWFRVVTNKDGGIASCDAVEGQEHDGKGIFYVDAQTPAAACLAAKQMWLERYEKARLGQNARQQVITARRKAAGLCQGCGKPSRPGKVYCRPCQDYNTAATRERRRARADLKPELTEAEKIEHAKRRLQVMNASRKKALGGLNSTGAVKLYLLRRTLAAFRAMTGPQFEGHLVAQIAELEAKRQQKPEPKAQAAE